MNKAIKIIFSLLTIVLALVIGTSIFIFMSFGPSTEFYEDDSIRLG